MNGTMLRNKLPKFVDMNNLPDGYYDEYSPLKQRTSSTINIRKLSRYVKEHNCSITEITKEESKFFMTKN